jgi:hypothetical protein
MQGARALLAGSIDYAGLFPPASLGLGEASANYRAYRRSPQAWLLGRLVLPAASVLELADAGEFARDSPLELSVLLAAEPLREWEALKQRLAAADASAAHLASVELKADDPARLRLLAELPRELEVFCEVEPTAAERGALEAVAASARLAKVRSGALTPEGIPSPALLADFLWRCHQLDLPLKATAGLHRALRGERELTYAKDSPRGVMHGFLNLFVGAALLRAGRVDATGLLEVLEERDAHSFRLSAEGIQWRTQRLTQDELRRARSFLRSFGSCSFEEPCQDLREMGWLP